MATGTNIRIDDKSGTHEIFKEVSIEHARDFITNRYPNVGWENAEGTKLYADVPTRGCIRFELTAVEYISSR